MRREHSEQKSLDKAGRVLSEWSSRRLSGRVVLFFHKGGIRGIKESKSGRATDTSAVLAAPAEQID
jgi:hypothetical protein